MNLSVLFPLAYVLPVLLAFALLFLFPITRDIRDPAERHQYFVLQAITFLGALVGAKLVFLMGDRLWPAVPLSGWGEVLTSGRSIVGGLLFGFLFAELAKPLLRYRRPPNDRFAAILPFSIAIGRVGCLLHGCCRGLPHEGLLSMTYEDGISRYPAPVFEILFQVATGLTLLWLVRRGLLYGRLFAVYLVAYGSFRFLTEFLRETPKVVGPYSVYQGFCLVLIVLGVASFLWRTSRHASTAFLTVGAIRS